MKVFIHPEAKPWSPSKEDWAKILAFYGSRLEDDSQVYLWPRHLSEQVVPGKKLPPYSFRAVTRENVSNVFVDPTETRASVAFLIGHELTHQLVRKSPVLEKAFHDARPENIQRHTDLYHLVDAEERFCDGISSKVLGTFYDRAWWRSRVLASRRRPPQI